MYGIENETLFWDKVGISLLHLLVHGLIWLVHGLVCGIVIFFTCLVFREFGLYVGIFVCGYISNPFVKHDMLEIWRV